jgi:hypothetical protein
MFIESHTRTPDPGPDLKSQPFTNYPNLVLAPICSTNLPNLIKSIFDLSISQQGAPPPDPYAELEF